MTSSHPRPAEAWTLDAIRRRVDELGEWFQNLDLHGVPTAPRHFLGDYPAAKWRQISRVLPERMDGLSVLDIGCNAGFHALECKRRGARYVLGVDADERYLAQARFAASVLGLEVEWRQMSVYALAELRRQFDYVFFLGVFYHLRYPVYALDLVVTLVRQRLVFQTMLRGASSGGAPLEDYGFWDHTPFQQPGFPRMYFLERSFAGDPTNWWIPNRAAAEGILRSSGLQLVAHPEPETWICAPAPEQRARGFVWDLELEAKL
ncbi:MAG TPA: TIGR04290 family methyltransferase [Terriglobales bacterium]|nr:TIGR04290 family methyltransferase [Terriglobales bacterium]